MAASSKVAISRHLSSKAGISSRSNRHSNSSLRMALSDLSAAARLSRSMGIWGSLLIKAQHRHQRPAALMIMMTTSHSRCMPARYGGLIAQVTNESE